MERRGKGRRVICEYYKRKRKRQRGVEARRRHG